MVRNTVYIYSMPLLADLTRCFHLYAVCCDCERMISVCMKTAIERLGPAVTVNDVRQRLKCQQCGQRTSDVRIVYVGPCANAAGFYYRS